MRWGRAGRGPADRALRGLPRAQTSSRPSAWRGGTARRPGAGASGDWSLGGLGPGAFLQALKELTAPHAVEAGRGARAGLTHSLTPPAL